MNERGRSVLDSRTAWALMFIALACTALAFWAVDRFERERISLRFRESANDLARRWQRKLQGINDDLHSARALFEVAPGIDREAFSAFVRPLLSRHTELTAIEWVPRVRATEHPDYDRRARADGFDFRITERDEAGRAATTAPRAEHYPVFYFEPRAGNEAAFGLDIAANAEKRAALYAARDSGLTAVVGPLRLVQYPDDPSGYVLVVPCYARGEQVGSGDARRDSFAGAVLGVVRITQFLAASVDPQIDRRLDVEILDGGRSLAMRDAADVGRPAARDAATALSIEIPLSLGDRELTLRVRAAPEFVAERRTRMPAVVAAGGGVLCVTLALYLGSLRREYAGRLLVDEAMAASERRYRTLVETAPEAVLVYDTDARRFVDANRKAEGLLGLTRERILGSSPFDISPVLQPDGRESAVIIDELLRRVLAGEEVVVPWNQNGADGQEIPVEVRLCRMPTDDRNLIRCSVIDVRDRRQSELRQLMMARELDHRVKNNLATVLSIAEQTCASARSIEDFRDVFVGRIRAMARTHETLAARSWDGVLLGEIAQLMLEPYLDGTPDRAVIRGEPVRLSPAASSGVCMALHELAANAAKYGALSDVHGRIDLVWRCADGGDLVLEWNERDGPRVAPPTTTGFGSRLIKGVVSHELGGRVILEYGSTGVHCRMNIPSEHWTLDGMGA